MRKHAAIHDRDAAEVPPDTGLVQETRDRELPQELLPFPCNYCPERFDALKKLSVHERKEHGEVTDVQCCVALYFKFQSIP